MDDRYVVIGLTDLYILQSGTYMQCWQYLEDARKFAKEKGLVILKESDWFKFQHMKGGEK